MENETVLQEVTFDKKVVIYWYLQGALVHLVLIFMGIGLVTFPIWLLVGTYFCGRRYEAMKARLTTTSIHLTQGYITKVEKTIPLEKIQDLGMKTGPLLNMFGLASIQIETAGGGAQQGSDMILAGVVDPSRFRNAVLKQRELMSGRGGQSPPQGGDSTVGVLTDIRDSLHRIEGLLAKE